MHERELRAFVSIADIGRMDHAAEYLGYSQSAVSYQIKCLEQALGTRLFDRDSTGARLTREGRMILPSARAMLSLFESIKSVGGV
ncbi:LysR family transcriptional regulator [Streptomyces xanthophaeus]|uniref:LysR family transcriptional regulator n=1 Tax=Streptomyces xanthophaeus TaxID=67385 RepID=UPI00399022B8